MKRNDHPREPGRASGIAREMPLSSEDAPPDISPSRSWWGEIGVLGGGAAIAAFLIAGHPDYGAWLLGRWRIAGIALGLVALGAGLVAMVRPSARSAPLKLTFVAATITAVGGFAFFGVEQLPTALSTCTTVDEPTPENRGTVYCLHGDGSLLRISIDGVDDCGAHTIAHATRTNGEWSTTWHSFGCRL